MSHGWGHWRKSVSIRWRQASLIFYTLPLRATESLMYYLGKCIAVTGIRHAMLEEVIPIGMTRSVGNGSEQTQKPAATGLGLVSLQPVELNVGKETPYLTEGSKQLRKKCEETQETQLPNDSSVLVSFIHSHCMAKMRKKVFIFWQYRWQTLNQAELYESVEY